MTDMQYYSLLTNSGHQANIKAKALGLPIILSKVAFGSGNITPVESATKLAKEEIRVNINSIVQSETDSNILEIEAVIPSDAGGFLVNEAALYLEDGTLYAIASLPQSYKPSLDQGAGKEFIFTIFLASVGVENVTLKIDDSIVFATRKYVLSELKKYALINGDETKKFKVANAVEDNESINKKQFDDNAVKLSGNQTIAGIKTFGSTISGSINGNAATATKLATARTIGGVSFDGSANINLPGVNTAGNQNTTGNSATATKLATARTINGVSFDGTANIVAPTNLGITAGTTAGPIVTSSTGANATLPTASASASGVVTTRNQTWAGVKTFSSSPIVPTPTTGTQAVNKDYADLKVALADFTGTNQSLGVAGYQKLPGGLILQWATVSESVSASDYKTFPIAFPTTCFMVNIQLNSASYNGLAENSGTVIQLIDRTKFIWTGGGTFAGGGVAYMFAIGR